MSRSGCSTLINILLLLLLIGLIIWLFPDIRARLSPTEAARRTLGQEVESLLHPTPTIRPSPATIIKEVRSLARLETVVYTVEKVITAETGQGALAFLLGDKLLFVAHGRVIAGVDLEKVRETDVTVTADDRVILVLPPPEIFETVLDNEKSYVYDRRTGLFGLNPDLETAARQAAEQEIRNAALADGILETAERNAQAYLDRLIRGFGFREVVFLRATPVATPATSVQPVTVVPAVPTP
ncbi:MAG: DUF4230 domain-containing protein [Anaerolineae bacterium]|nr:DUF4230 domain-containing protein [Anaerolineae bacterium]MCX8067261.1 DUF4230 domain-containing protein [Anaerolineae bacterium]MDW7992280.1 DUF4230 domain-containing protein [Anaerolineae bacterium]